MSYSLDIELKEQYLHVTITGENSLSNVNACFNEVYGACILYRCSKVLVQQYLVGPSLDTLEMYEFITRNRLKAKSINLQLAFTDMNADHDPQRLKFAENLALIAGLNVRIFSTNNLDEMADWLKGEINIE